MRERSDVGKSQSVIGRPTAKDSVVEKTVLGRAISVDGNALPNLEGLENRNLTAFIPLILILHYLRRIVLIM